MCLINGSVCPTDEIIELVKKLEPGQTIISGETIIALHMTAEELDNPVIPPRGRDRRNRSERTSAPGKPYMGDLFKNDMAIRDDFDFLTKGRKSHPLNKTNVVLGDNPVFLERGAKVNCAVLNTTHGPIYIGAGAEIMEGSMIRGPMAICDHAQVKMLCQTIWSYNHWPLFTGGRRSQQFCDLRILK